MRGCAEPGCGEPHYAHGLCKPHYMRGYMRLYRNGSLIVHSRHREAMRLVRSLSDEDARWRLLGYVIEGSEQIDRALTQAA